MFPSLLLLAALLLRPSPAVESPASPWDEVLALRNDQGPVDADPARRAGVRELLALLARDAPRGAVPGGVEERAEELGLLLERGEDGLVLHSRPERADGYFALRLGPAEPEGLVLQAPHAWYDRETGRLASLLYDEQGLGRALCLNTAQRYRGGNALQLAGREDADLAHRPDTVFQAATLGLVDGLPAPVLLVQLHGFSASHGSYAAVVSAGSTLEPPAWLREAAARLGEVLGEQGEVVTCEEVPELCATTNVQSAAISGRARFLHLELSYPARQALLRDVELRERLACALRDVAEARP